MQETNVHEERRSIPEGACPVDLMGELFQTKSENEFLAFTLTAKAFLAMCAFPVKKEVVFYLPWGEEQSVAVEWISSKQYMVFTTCDKCKTFKATRANTDEIKCDPMPDEVTTHYIIDVE